MSAPPPPILECRTLGVDVPGRTLVQHLDLSLGRGELLAVLGQNGTGKSLTLQTLAGLREQAAGLVLLNARDIFELRRQDVARQLALLPQVIEDIFPATVMDTVLVGRHPHIGYFRRESPADFEIATAALAMMQLEELAQRDILTLSGGERRRLALAQVLAQAPAVYLLDEPTNHLDPQHQLDTMRVFRRAADEGTAVIASLHDVNLAVRYADRCLLLFGDGRWRLGSTAEVLSEQDLGELYATPMEAVDWRGHTLFVAG